MTDYQTYTTESEARTQIARMAGWPDAHPEQLCLPDDANADADGNVWVIACGTGDEWPTLRSDGYVR